MEIRERVPVAVPSSFASAAVAFPVIILESVDVEGFDVGSRCRVDARPVTAKALAALERFAVAEVAEDRRADELTRVHHERRRQGQALQAQRETQRQPQNEGAIMR